ncbi:MAG: hypothetical protein VZR09_05270 [Candidatus Gastranaerophilaceae bacterium]|nr:hypothetical protein [Candidatus Gastranaerophilaceae bacterium]
MHIIITLTILVNILSIIMFLIGLFYDFKQPKNKAVYGYSLAGCMILYMVTLCFVSLYGLIVNHNLYGFILFLCVVSPFIIGKLVKYETLKKYTVAQIMCFIVSLIILLMKF